MGAAGQRRPFGPAGECAPLDRGGCLPVARDGGGGGLPLPPAADGRNNSARRSSRKHGRKAGLSVHNPRWSERKFRCLCARVERSCVECGLFEISLCFTWRPPLDVNSSFQLNSYTSGNPILVLAMALAGPMCEGPQKPRKQSTGKQSTGNHNISPGVKPPVLPLRWHRPVELSPAAGLRRRHHNGRNCSRPATLRIFGKGRSSDQVAGRGDDICSPCINEPRRILALHDGQHGST